MHISGSCCPFLHTAVAEGMAELNVPARKPLFLHLDVSRRGTIKILALQVVLDGTCTVVPVPHRQPRMGGTT
jgi:hypothetical protein